MFRKPLSTTSALDKAIIACVAAMLGFNALVLAHQLDAAPVLAMSMANPSAEQA